MTHANPRCDDVTNLTVDGVKRFTPAVRHIHVKKTLVSNDSPDNVTPWCRQHVAGELRVERAWPMEYELLYRGLRHGSCTATGYRRHVNCVGLTKEI